MLFTTIQYTQHFHGFRAVFLMCWSSVHNQTDVAYRGGCVNLLWLSIKQYYVLTVT